MAFLKNNQSTLLYSKTKENKDSVNEAKYALYYKALLGISSLGDVSGIKNSTITTPDEKNTFRSPKDWSKKSILEFVGTNTVPYFGKYVYQVELWFQNNTYFWSMHCTKRFSGKAFLFRNDLFTYTVLQSLVNMFSTRLKSEKIADECFTKFKKDVQTIPIDDFPASALILFQAFYCDKTSFQFSDKKDDISFYSKTVKIGHKKYLVKYSTDGLLETSDDPKSKSYSKYSVVSWDHNVRAALWKNS